MPNPLPVVLDVHLPSRQPLVSGLLGIAGTAVAVPNVSLIVYAHSNIERYVH